MEAEIDAPVVEQPPVTPKYKLWQSLNNTSYYTKSFADFDKQFSTPDQINKLHSALSDAQYYTKSSADFNSQFFSPPAKNGSPSGGQNTLNLSQAGSNFIPSSPQITQFSPIIDEPTRQANIDRQRQQATALSQQLQANYDRLDPELKKAVGNIPIRHETVEQTPQSEVDHMNFMNSTLGKVVTPLAYLSSKATHGTLQIAKGVAHMFNMANNPASMGLPEATDPFFDKADKLADFNLTQGDIGRIEDSKKLGNSALSAAGMAAQFAPAVLGGEIGETAHLPKAMMYLQGVGMGKEVADKIPNLNPLAKEALIQGSGVVNLALTDIGNNIFNKGVSSTVKDKIISGIAADAIKESAGKDLTAPEFKSLLARKAQDFATKFERAPSEVLKHFTDASKTFTKLDFGNFALHKGVDALQSAQGDKPVFNENMGNLAENLSNSMTKAVPMFGSLGAVGSASKLLPNSSYENDVVKSAMTDPSSDNIDLIKQQLQAHGEQQGWTPDEIQATHDHVDKIAQAAKSLPPTIPEKDKSKAVGLVLDRNVLQDELAKMNTDKKQLDPSIQDLPTAKEQYLTDKVEQANDKLRDIVGETKSTYSKGVGDEEGKFFKTVNGDKEEIAPSRYELERMERDAKKETINPPIENESTNEKNGEESSQSSEESSPENGSESQKGDAVADGQEGNVVNSGEAQAEPVTNEVQDGTNTTEPTPAIAGEVQPSEATAAEATPKVEEKPTGIKKAISEATRVEKKLPEVKLSSLGKDADTLKEGKNLVDKGEIKPSDVADRVIKEKGIYTPEEAKAMQYYGHQLSQAESDIQSQLDEAKDDPSATTLIHSNLQQLNDKIDNFTQANRINSRSWSNLGNIMQIESDQSFSPSNIRTIIKENYGGEIPKEVQDKIDKAFAERDKAISELKKATADLIKKNGDKVIEKMRGSIKIGKQSKAELQVEAEKLKLELIKAFKYDIGRANSGLPLPTETLAVLGKLAVNYFKQGIKNFEGLANRIYDDLKETGVDKNSIREYLSNYEPLREEAKAKEMERLERKEKSINKQLETGKIIDRTPKPKIVFKKDNDILRAEQRVADAEYKLKQEKQKSYRATEGGLQRFANWFLRWERRSILANPLTSIKLAAASVSGPIMRLAKEPIGALYSFAFSKLADKAPIEGGMNIKAELEYWKQFWNPKKFGTDALQILKTGASPLKKRFGTKFIEHHAGWDALMDVHSIIKSPLHRATYEASLMKIYEYAAKNNWDYTDPAIKKSLEQVAFDRAEYEIFQESGTLGKKISQILDDETKTNSVKRFIYKFLFPINLVPTNITKRMFSSSPFGLVNGAYKVGEAYKKGIDNLTPEQADFILRQLKNGTVGSAFYALGYFSSRSMLGGLWQKDDKDAKKSLPNRLAYNEMKMGGWQLDKRIQHGMPLHLMQLGATNKRVYDHYMDTQSEDNSTLHQVKAVGNAVGATMGAEAEESPFLNKPYHFLGALFDPYERQKFVGELGRSTGYDLIEPSIENRQQLGKDISNKDISGIISDITDAPKDSAADKKIKEIENSTGDKVTLSPEQVTQRKDIITKSLEKYNKDWTDEFNDDWEDEKNTKKIKSQVSFWKSIGRSESYIKNKLGDMKQDALNTYLQKQVLDYSANEMADKIK